jgi:hypothetical protein
VTIAMRRRLDAVSMSRGDDVRRHERLRRSVWIRVAPGSDPERRPGSGGIRTGRGLRHGVRAHAECFDDRVTGTLGEQAPGVVVFADGRRGKEMDLRGEPGVANHPQQMGEKGIVADEGRDGVGLLVCVATVGEGHRLDHQPGLPRQRKQARVESQHPRAVARRPLGKEHQGPISTDLA